MFLLQENTYFHISEGKSDDGKDVGDRLYVDSTAKVVHLKNQTGIGLYFIFTIHKWGRFNEANP